ncbi:peptidoglycan/LPS O-acetylase OafA/YrhL [Arcicella aurantiaca]|uniref:Peptidoglycan/LPS O-acetylase OafA/YrhL n=1 Tax=Arcicella aurantiaca TaxID=591202 RepID=A0A316E6Z3_9BACT|nr:acyltransferase [Arcicella aurantiaca]PWK26181.1 peptidoglycan/LPS O-acetylase OafA/YrhL [Arcicella aurantiaca]
MNRLKSLDILRGLTAFAIMFYHFSIWTNKGEAHTADSFLGRIGLYGVSIFFVLSGLTMYLVYHHKMQDSKAIKSFFIKRIFRIYPLYWLACLGSIFFLETPATNMDILWNITGLFAFINTKSLTTGGWSIGNELVFYAFFPLLIWLSKDRKHFFLTVIWSVSIGIFFAFSLLNNTSSMTAQWLTYTNPFNQLFFFVAGISLGKMSDSTLFFKQHKTLNFIILFLMISLFVFYPTVGQQTNLISGINRIVFSVLSIAICYFIFTSEVELPIIIEKPLTTLGEISYGVYLIHPIIFLELRQFLANYIEIPPQTFFVIALFVTVFISFLIYSWLEKPLIRLGKKIK